MLSIAVLFPDLLGTYGDGGNAAVLETRARARGIHLEVHQITVDSPMVEADLFLLGGGEDGPQRLACDLLQQRNFVERFNGGAHVFAVCAGLQILGTSFEIEGKVAYPGLGLVDAVTTRGETRSVGDLATRVRGQTLVGFENHGGVTKLARGVESLGTVLAGRGNDGSVDGFRAARLMATYAHGPVLAQNPWLADELLSELVGETLSPWSSVADRLYEERCAEINTRRSGGGHK